MSSHPKQTRSAPWAGTGDRQGPLRLALLAHDDEVGRWVRAQLARLPGCRTVAFGNARPWGVSLDSTSGPEALVVVVPADDAEAASVLERLSALARALPLVVVTAADQSHLHEVAMTSGAEECWPLAALGNDVFEHVLRSAAARHRRRSPAPAVGGPRIAQTALFEALVRSAPLAVIAIDQGRTVSLWNPAAERLFGWSQAEMLGRSPLAIVPDALREQVRSHPLLGALSQGRPFGPLDTVRRHKDGSLIEVRVSAGPVRSVDGDVVGAVTFIADDRERRRAEAALAAQHERLEQIFAHTRDAILVIDVEADRFAEVNPTATKIFGYAVEELCDMAPSALWPDHVDELGTFLRRILASGRSDTGEWTCHTGDGRKLACELSVSCVEFKGRPHALAVVRDITQRKEAAVALARSHDELEQRAAQLERANAESAAMAYGISHDLAEPLRMVSTYLELLNRSEGDRLPADAAEFLEWMREGVKRMRTLLDALRAFAEAGAVDRGLSDADSGAVVEEVLHTLAPVIDENGATVTVGGLPRVHGDPVSLGQLFQNLLTNAVKFSAPGRPPVIQVSASRQGAWWRFAVRDNGIGIDPRYRDEIFHMFRRLSSTERYRGSGVGLAICRKVVERHGGRIWVESDPGSGSTFMFLLPAAKKR